MERILCQSCATKGNWPFEADKAFRRSCHRCFQFTLCNSYLTPGKVSPAPDRRDLVPSKGEHASSKLPKAKAETKPHSPPQPAAITDADKMLDAVQPNRKGIKLQTVRKGA